MPEGCIAMLDWLRRDPREVPELDVAGRILPVQVRRNNQARRLTMRLSADGSAIMVTIPRWTPTGEAVAFARSRIDWLEAQAARIPESRALHDGGQFPFRGQLVTLRHDHAAPRRIAPPQDGHLRIGGAAESLQSRLLRWLKQEALHLAKDDLAHYCALADKPVPALSLSGAQRRWGSCSTRGVVRINWRLIMAPDFVRRSVVAHEVAHLVHFDHSPQFKAFLARLFEGDLPEADHWLRREGRSLYAHFG
jgi:predicted metal-dependent hydrolase